MKGGLSHYPPVQRALELAGLGAFAALAAFAAAGLRWDFHLVPAALGGWLLADLLSGLVHWSLDRLGSERTPIVGAILIRPFREHHADMLAMTRHDFVETNGASALGAAVLLAPCLEISGEFGKALMFFAAVGVLAANQCHKWAHVERPPVLVRAAQRLRLILAPEAHARHHRAPYDCHYCTASGWLNRPLDLVLRAWR